MRGSLWSLVVVSIGGALMLRGAGTAAPDSAANSTSELVTLFDQLTPFLGELLAVVAVAWLLLAAILN